MPETPTPAPFDPWLLLCLSLGLPKLEALDVGALGLAGKHKVLYRTTTDRLGVVSWEPGKPDHPIEAERGQTITISTARYIPDAADIEQPGLFRLPGGGAVLRTITVHDPGAAMAMADAIRALYDSMCPPKTPDGDADC